MITRVIGKITWKISYFTPYCAGRCDLDIWPVQLALGMHLGTQVDMLHSRFHHPRWPASVSKEHNQMTTFLCSDTAVSYISQWGIGAGKWRRSIRRCVVRIGPTGKPKTSTGRWGRPASVQLGFVWVGWILVPFFNYRNRGRLCQVWK